jgi:hypothetical protein
MLRQLTIPSSHLRSILTIFFSGTVALCGGEVQETLALSVRCPTCGAKPGEKCELSTGQPRTTPHRDRRIIAKDEEQ